MLSRIRLFEVEKDSPFSFNHYLGITDCGRGFPSLRWLGTVVTSHTAPPAGKHTHQSCPWFKKLYKVLTALRAINQHAADTQMS